MLIESGEDPRKRLGRGVSEDDRHNSNDGAIGQGHALTLENMQKFSMKDRTASLKREGPKDDDASSMNVTIGDGSASHRNSGQGQLSQTLASFTSKSSSGTSRKPG